MTTDATATLVSVPDLAERLTSQPAPVLLDVRWQVGGPHQLNAYLAGHIPGARWCDLDRDLADPPSERGRHPLPDPQRLQARVAAWGIDQDSDVIVYDGADSVAASRAWWVLRWSGLSAVRVLDGGFAAWAAADRPVQTEVTPASPGTATLRPGSLPVLDADAVAKLAAQGRLVDVRAPERFRGEVEPIDPVAGHIAGAVNLPTTGNVTAAGTFRPVAVLADRFRAGGVPSDGPVGVYCGSGVTAAHTVLAMHLAGIDATLYPGSWSEWIADPTHPVATGP